MRKPKVSIIVPVYNAASYIRRCVDSIRMQTMEEWEAILVDDGSTDESGRICDSYAMVDSRFRAIHKANGGVSSARECGLQYSKGEYLIHVDSDDYVDSTMLEELYRKAKEDNADMVICDFVEEWYWGTKVQKQQPNSLDARSIIREFFGHLHGSCCNKLVRRSCFDEYDIHFPKGMNYCEDEYVNIALLLHNIRVSYLPKAFYHYDHAFNDASIVNSSANSIQRTIIRIDRLSELLSKDYLEIIDRLKLTAKQRCIDTWQPYSLFLSLYPEISGQIYTIENDYSVGHTVSWSMKSWFVYQFVCMWKRFKDWVFVARTGVKCKNIGRI